MAGAVSGMRCYRVDERPSYIKATYNRLALVAHRRHVSIYSDDEDTLLVSSNWLLWQECLANGWHATHIDQGLLGWEEAQDLGNSLYLRANDWMFFDGRDATEFRNVSLGIKINTSIIMLLSEYEKLTRGLEMLVREFQPQEIVFHDLMTDFGFLDMSGRLAIVKDVAERFGLVAIDETDPLGDGEPGFPVMKKDSPLAPEKTRRSDITTFGLRLLEGTLGLLSRLRELLGSRRPSVLLLVTQLTGIPLLEAFREKAFYAQYLARWWPNKRNLANTLRCLWRGILIVGGGVPKLSPEDETRLAEIKKTFDAAWANDAAGVTREVRRYVQRDFLSETAITDAAWEVIWIESVLDRARPSVIVADGLRNFITHAAFSIGKRRGMTTIATWHATISQKFRMVLFGSDARMPPLADKCLTWGTAHERWLKGIGAKTQIIRTGNVVSSRHRGGRKRQERDEPGRRTALVLQYFLGFPDYRTPPSDEYFYFVEVVRMLAELGFREVRLKLHPGVPREPYYRRIADVFGLDCEVVRSGDLAKHIAWADIAVGPASSGAMLEIIESGLPFFPVLLDPNSKDMFDDDWPEIFRDLSSLRSSISEKSEPDITALAERFTSSRIFPNPAATVWEILRRETEHS